MITRKTIAFLGLFSALSVIGYLFASYQYSGIGFPLDDSWIHQTYARNLVSNGEWAFFPGQPSGGSTAPLWAVLIALGNIVRLGPFLWTITLGWALLWGLSIISIQFLARLVPAHKNLSIWAGILIIIEWHLVWAAVSGMETLLFALFVMAIFGLLMDFQEEASQTRMRLWFLLGILVGASAWVRPEGITMLGFVGLSIFLINVKVRYKIKTTYIVGIGFLLTFGPYLLFNQLIVGDWWPNTFYAKQAEYAILRNAPIWLRYIGQFNLLLVGVGALLLPGFAKYIYDSITTRNWRTLLPALWVMAHLGLYALRLPVTYQHGRYIMPAMPIYFILGLAGMASWLQSSSINIGRRVVSRAWLLSIGLVALSFWWLGATAYARDVTVINSEMVITANWIVENTSSDDVIAAHDIGVLGYFTDRTIVDMAGLISPDVISFIRDESKLAAYLNAKGVKYLVTFPSFYPEMVLGRKVIFQTDGEISASMGEENMKVYLWGDP